jgi:acyl transferase domain-containing protein
MQQTLENSSTGPLAPKEPIAIIGIGCRFPGGANSPEAFWQLLTREVDAITEMPAGRFDIDSLYHPTPATPGKIVTRQGGFLEQIDQFDAAFFNISPREANCMDPQQRLLLEVVWEAFEDAGQLPAKLAGSRTGVFIGMWTNDYEDKMYDLSQDVDLYITTGGGRYAASGRISYIFDFQGPSMTLDTACSSSLVAVHLACQSLWNGESELALAGGVNLILEPQISIGYSRSKMLSPDARCKFGDAQANGYVRSEGVGVILLKPLSQALADKDPIYALVRGSAVNNDGRSSELLVAPSPKTQIQMLREAYRSAGVMPGQVSYVEAHGTGTRVGDPVELQALGAVLAEGRPAGRPCLVGSVKTNIGHAEAASGIAGLIKAALCLKHRAIPASLHFREPNPAIPWSELPMVVQQQGGPWPAQDGPALAGVNSFGVTGTNAHIVLQEPPASPEKKEAFQPTDSRAYLIPLSAHTSEALTEQAQALILFAQKGSLQDLGYTLALRRTHHPYRLTLVAHEPQELDDLLQAFLSGKASPNISSGHQEIDRPLKTVFVFPGQGSQWLGMGRQLLAVEPVFRQTLETCEQAMQPFVNWSLLEQLAADETSANYRLHEIDVLQPTLLAIEIALAVLWRARGVEPDAVIGHSMGEVAAAYVAGALTLGDAMRIICRRSQLLRRTSGQGAMAVVGLSLDQAEEALDGYRDRLSVAVSNSPRSTVLSGDPAALEDILAKLKAQNVFCRPVKVDVASHSPQMEPLKDDLLAALAGIQPQMARVPIYSTAVGEVSDGSTFDAAYWVRNLRQPVRFALMVERLLEADHTIFIEMSPHPILLTAIEETGQHASRKVHPIASLRRDQPEQATILGSLGQLHSIGYAIGWPKLYPTEGRVVQLPAYPWQRRRFWLEAGSTNNNAHWEAAARGGSSQDHPLLGHSLPQLAHLPGSYFWQNRLNGRFRAYLSRYRLEDADVLPDQVYAEMALAATAVILGDRPFILSEFTTYNPLPLSLTIEPLLQVILTIEANAASFKIYSRNEETEEWRPHAAGKVELGQINADWLYELQWQLQPPTPLVSSQPTGPTGAWLIFSDPTGVGIALGKLLAERGQSRIVVLPGESYERLDNGIFKINPLQAADYQRLLDEILVSQQPYQGIIHLWALTDKTQEMTTSLLQKIQAVQCGSVLHLVQNLAQRQGLQLPRLWLITRQAQPVGEVSQLVAVDQAALWGLGRTVALEHPDLWGGLIDLDVNTAEQNALALLTEILRSAAEDQVAFRGAQRYVARLVRQQPRAAIEPVRFMPDGTYLITGGLGGLGLIVAQWLVEQGVRHLALLGRRPPLAQAEVILQEMVRKGVQVITLQADVSQPDQLDRAMAEIDRQMPPLRGIIHAAGILDDGVLSQQSWDRFARVFAPKMDGAWNLHRLSLDRPLDCFILFSSITALLGSPGQGNYAAANAFLDGLAHARRAQGLPALSINWGVWAEVGLAMQHERVERMARRGFKALQPEEGTAALTYLCHQNVAQSAISTMDWFLYLGQLPPNSKNLWLSEQAGAVNETGAGETVSTQKVEIWPQLHEARAEERYNLLLNYVRSQVAGVMGFGGDYPLEVRQGFFQLGMDSLMTVELRNRLQTALPCTLTSTLAFDYPTIAILTQYLLTTLFPPEAPAPEVTTKPNENLSILEELSRDELKALLDQELASIDEGILE